MNEWLNDHQILHFSLGFIDDPIGQLNAWENCGEFDNVPMTRYCDGVCGSLRIWIFNASGVLIEHHTCAKPMKNNWFCVKFNPGNWKPLSPFCCDHFVKA